MSILDQSNVITIQPASATTLGSSNGSPQTTGTATALAAANSVVAGKWRGVRFTSAITTANSITASVHNANQIFISTSAGTVIGKPLMICKFSFAATPTANFRLFCGFSENIALTGNPTTTASLGRSFGIAVDQTSTLWKSAMYNGTSNFTTSSAANLTTGIVYMVSVWVGLDGTLWARIASTADGNAWSTIIEDSWAGQTFAHPMNPGIMFSTGTTAAANNTDLAFYAMGVKL